MNHGRCPTCSSIVIPEVGEDAAWRFAHLPVQKIISLAHQGCTFCRYLDKGLGLRARAKVEDKRVSLHQFWESDSQYLQAGIEGPGSSNAVGSADFELREVHYDDEFYVKDVLSEVEMESVQLHGYLSQVTAAKAFLSDCLDHHGATCAQEEVGYLPHRVVDVATGDDEELRLYIPESPIREKYVALSYCWGQTNNFVTTSQNLTQHQQSFKLSSLPRTLQDAVKMTRGLGLRYIWIDALCVIQGRDEAAVKDWSLQVSHMGDVYGNALVTISATASSHADEGFLPSPCSLPSSRSQGGRRHLAVSLRSLRKEYGSLPEQPVNTRAWCMQEYLLSRRVIMLTLQGVIWQCQNGIVKGPDTGKWSFFPSSYHCRNMTNPRDKFHAVAGLARRYRDATGDRYVAGLWESQFLESLLWHHAPDNQYSLPPAIHGRPEIYRAPSWSWASINGYVYLMDMRTVQYQSKILAEVLVRNVELADPENEFGEVLSASLTIRGPLQKVVVKWGEYHIDVFTADEESRNIGAANLDDPTDTSWSGQGTTQPAECLVIRGDDHAWGLLLVPNEHLPGTYIRKGVVWTKPYGKPTPCVDAPLGTRTLV
ncbi:heterokaryon incompatibility protein [Apiospora sp. TS-2023a]